MVNLGKEVFSLGLFGRMKAKKLLREAVEHHDHGDMERAEDAYRRAIEADSTFYEVYLNYAYFLEDMKRMDEAEWAYKKAIECNPRCAEAHTGLGIIYHSRRMLSDAVREFRAAVEANPSYIDAWINLGTCLIDLGQFPEAKSTFEEALKHTSDPEKIKLIKSKLIY